MTNDHDTRDSSETPVDAPTGAPADAPIDTHVDAEARVRATQLIAEGINLAQSGDIISALSALDEAERIAAEADLSDIVGSSRINRGYLHWVKGDAVTARSFFIEGAETARNAGDTPRLRSALTYLAATYAETGQWEEAIAAYKEYLSLATDELESRAGANMDCGLCYMETGDFEAAATHMEEAERLAAEAGVDDLLVASRMNRGVLRERAGDAAGAIVHYEAAAKAAREADLAAALAVALMNVAQAHRQLGEYAETDPLFKEIEEVYRSLGEDVALANALYWHALSLRDAGMSDLALATWREEEPIRLKLGQYSELGDCLFEQAAILLEREENATLETVYTRATVAYDKGRNSLGSAETIVRHGELLRRLGRVDEALTLADDALAFTTHKPMPDVECRVWGLRAALLIDLGRTLEARDDLDCMEGRSTEIEFAEQMVWALARRGYLLAREGAPVDEVEQQLRKALQYGVDNDQARAARNAVHGAILDIEAQCGDEYLDKLEALNQELTLLAQSESDQPASEEQ